MAGRERQIIASPERGDGITGKDTNVFSSAVADKDSETSRAQTAEQSKALARDGKLGNLDLHDSEIDSDHIEVGKTLFWSKESRQSARPQTGEGYQQVMKRIGQELLGRSPDTEELEAMAGAARVLQRQRGKDPNQLSVHDELLPKNENELDLFLKALTQKKDGPFSERHIDDLSKSLNFEIQKHLAEVPPAGTLVYDTRPVKDQAVVTKVVPNAVYLDNSHIEGGQGFRRTPKCEPETQEYWLAKGTADALMRAQHWLVDNGNNPIQLRNMNGAGRRALDRELISKCAPGQPHAKRHSQHEDGISIDVDNYDDPKVREALTRENFVHNVPGDRPHFTWFGPKKK